MLRHRRRISDHPSIRDRAHYSLLSTAEATPCPRRAPR